MTTERELPEDLALVMKLHPLVRGASSPIVAVDALMQSLLYVLSETPKAGQRPLAKYIFKDGRQKALKVVAEVNKKFPRPLTEADLSEKDRARLNACRAAFWKAVDAGLIDPNCDAAQHVKRPTSLS